MKKIFAPLMLIVFLISRCTFDVAVQTPAPAEPASSPATQNVVLPLATISATAETLPPTPGPNDPMFFGAFFALDPVDAPIQGLFPEKTKQVFAIWNYINMREDLTVKREWYLNGQLWLTREDPWEFAKYGASGTIRDISVYDFDAGLEGGVYQLRLYINNVPQPIGTSPSGGPQMWLNFEIHPDDTQVGGGSPDFQWAIEILDQKTIVFRDVNGTPTTLYTGREIPYHSWFTDSKHMLFVDRDRSQQQSGTTLGIRDDLWIAEIPSGELHLLYKSNTNFAGHAGPVFSPDGRFIVSMEGSGFGDACLIDSRLIFFELAGDFQSVKPIKQEQFAGFPVYNDGFVYPVEDGEWETANLFLVTLDGTCSVDKSQMGPYLFNTSNLTVSRSSSAIAPLIAGDLGWGKIHGKITDAVTGAPIAGATVTCEHNSYTSPVTCSGSATTNADGIYIFGTVFFHDTDTIKLSVQATGYQTQEITWTSFTMPDMETDFSLRPVP